MTTSLKFKAVPLKNSLGQTIEPGERVVVIVSSYNKSSRVKEATYVGDVPGNSWGGGGAVVVYDDGRHSLIQLRRVFKLETRLSQFSYL